MDGFNTNDLIMLLVLNGLGVYICSQEWVKIWSDGVLRGLGRLLVLNLPAILVLNLMLMRS